jgi:uncharacterized protein YrrD
MTDINAQTYDAWIGHQVVDRDGNKIGKVSQIYVDDQTGRPEWLAVNTGLFSSKSSFVPLSGAAVQGDQLTFWLPKRRTTFTATTMTTMRPSRPAVSMA